MSEHHHDGYAIVGMACIFPGAPDLKSFRHNLEHGIDAITAVPADRWDPAHYDPQSDAADRFYCKRGGFLDGSARFDPLAFGVMPVAAEGAEPDQMLALSTASRALADAGYTGNGESPRRGAVILGRGGYLGAGLVRLSEHVRVSRQLVDCLRALVPGLTERQLGEVRDEFRSQLGHYGPDTAIGLVPNLVASRIANRLDLQGPAYTVDAACASALVAVEQACRELAEGRCDLAIAGGVHLCHDVTFWSVFSQLGALSRSEQIRPFDRRADGLLIGEGIGMVVLKRLEDARQRDDRIYAVVRGTGVSSDGRGVNLMQPSPDGQLAALAQAWEAARLDPATVGLLEAHGTGTPTGDVAELTSLARFFGRKLTGRPVIGSVKSMIGHAMPAAGAAGLIKAALAVHHGVRPPTIHCEQPHELLNATGFRVTGETEEWNGNGVPRRAGVNAFGFGGINAHVILEGVTAPRGTRAQAVPVRLDAIVPQMLRLGARTPEELLEALDRGRPTGESTGPCRLVVHDPTPARREKARKIVERGQAWRGRGGIWFSLDGLIREGGKIAFLFPGVDAVFEPRIEDVAAHFGLAVPRHGTPREVATGDLEQVGAGIIGVGSLLNVVLGELGIRPDAIAGHSIGEWSGMIAAGILRQDEVDELISTLVPGTLEVPGVVFAAAGCGADRAEAAMRGLDEIAVSHDNCPHQILLCGREDSIDSAIGRLMSEGVLCQKLPFRSGFHSPLFADYVEPNRRKVRNISFGTPRLALWSATTCEPYPDDGEAIAALTNDHLVRPVRFRELIERLYAEGVRVFIQVGTGRLVGFVSDTLHGRPHAALAANQAPRSGIEQLCHVAGGVWAEGGAVRFERLPIDRNEPRARDSQPISLKLGSPLTLVRKPLELDGIGPEPEVESATPADPLLAEFQATMHTLRRTEVEVRQAWRRAKAARLAPRKRTRKIVFSLEQYPALIDHCFYRQPDDWPNLADRFPVVPMTTTVAMILDEARALVPERVPIAVERVRAYRWIEVEPPKSLDVRLRFDGVDAVEVHVEGHASATVRLAESYPDAPEPAPFADEEARPTPVDAARMYAERLMFHGPRFQGVRELGPFSADGIRGVLESLPAPGALLDNAGQLFGYWIQLQGGDARLAFPSAVDRMTFFGAQPSPGAEVACHVHIREDGSRSVRADLDLVSDGRLWARIEGWEDRRFDTGKRLWSAMRFPETTAVGTMRHGAYCLVEETWRSPASRDLVARRNLGQAERAEYAAIAPHRRREWLLGRMAVKDAVRYRLWSQGHGPLFPVEIAVSDGPDGCSVAQGPFEGTLHASVAQHDRLAAAVVAPDGAVGIEIAHVEARGPNFEAVSFTESERNWLPRHDRDEWITRFWVAREAAARAQGARIRDDRRRFAIRDVSGERLRAGDSWVETRLEGRYVVGWTVG